MTYQIGDVVVHWNFGLGKIVGIDDIESRGQPCFYYVVETRKRTTIWVPVDDSAGSSLHLPTESAEFKLFINSLKSPGKEMPEHPLEREKQLDQRMRRKTLIDICSIIRDLTARSYSQPLNRNDIAVLKRAEEYLLDEWELSLGTPREIARGELDGVLKENPSGESYL